MSGKKILIVDDDPDVRQAMHVRLSSNGYETFVASDALTGVAGTQKHRPDLIILDLGLPAGDGFTVIERIKRIPALALIPIIVVSARNVAENKLRSIKMGASAFLQKPVDNSELLAVIRQALGEPALPPEAAPIVLNL
jgi:two-component system KDP operon response regulator KdpE